MTRDIHTLVQMTEDLLPSHLLWLRRAGARRGEVHLSATIALVVLFALGVIGLAIGISQAETLSAMVDDETGCLALFALTVAVIATGAVTAFIMWLTAPAPIAAKVVTGLLSERALLLARARFPRG
jgi:hypothetical protein